MAVPSGLGPRPPRARPLRGDRGPSARLGRELARGGARGWSREEGARDPTGRMEEGRGLGRPSIPQVAAARAPARAFAD